jgi:carbon monoxide dehydrogenase subunit G
MKLAGEQVLPVSQARAWAALHDTAVLQAAIPGCEALTPAGPQCYDLRMAVPLGLVTARFEGRLRLSSLDEPHGFRLGFEGSGGVAGHGKGSVRIALVALSPRKTQLAYTLNARVGGPLAAIGDSLAGAVAQPLADEFFKRLLTAMRRRRS